MSSQATGFRGARWAREVARASWASCVVAGPVALAMSACSGGTEDCPVLLGPDGPIGGRNACSLGSGGQVAAAECWDVLVPIDRESGREAWKSIALAGFDEHVVLQPVGPALDVLVVVLHGSGGVVANVSLVQEAATSAGFPTIGVSWYLDGGGPARDMCGAAPDDDALNDCVEGVRAKRFTFIDGALGDVLRSLRDGFPKDGWERFLDADVDGPRWSSIVLAGYSDGAHQAGYILREPNLFVRGSILVSGGGDCGTLEPCDVANPTPADWVLRPLEGTSADRLVGLLHEDEFNADLLQVGWDQTGMAVDRADALAVAPTDASFDAYSEAHRLEYEGHGGHTMVITDDALFPAYMYLACSAAS